MTDATTAHPRDRRLARLIAPLATAAILLAGCGAAAESDDTAATQTSPPPASEAAATDLFAYEQDTVDVTDVGTVEEQGREIRDVTYPSPHGGEVTAYIAEPDEPSDVGILMTPGIPEKRHQYLDPISRFACAGATAMVVDAPWARDPDRVGREFTFAPKDAEEQVQLVVDLRRAVDILTDMGAEQIGFDAISYGAGVGALLAGVEDRIDAYALLSGGVGPIRRFISEDGNALYPLTSKSPQQRQTWVDAMEPVEPEHFVGDATSPILFVAGREDTIVTPDEIELIHEAAGGTAELRWYDAGHELSPEAFTEHLDWLAEQVGLDQDRVDECFPPDSF